ncbi:MAG: hypothetical protein RTU92_02595 [Candidatus Thorarchaeota archaeon]
MTHSELVEIGYKWLMKSVKCSFAFKEMRTYTKETPDVIGWKNNSSVLIECKASRSDFLTDVHKSFRQYGGVGNYRFYLAPVGLLKHDDIPFKWGWLEANEKGGVVRRIAPKGNVWADWPRFEANLQAEAIMLQSALRRIQGKVNIQRFL